MPENKPQWTDQQKQAIAEHKRDVIVTASAGTGKTAVLSGSCVDVVSDAERCTDVGSILVLTFTNMAAEEMRSRIATMLRTAASQTGDPVLRRRLRHQTILLGAAEIGTIHSFCKRLISEFHYRTDIDPTFSVIEDDEATLLKAESLEKTIDWAWRQQDMAAGMGRLLRGRDLRENEGFLSTIIGISDYLDSVAWQENWFDRVAAMARAANPFDTELGRRQTQIIEQHLEEICERLRQAAAMHRRYGEKGEWAATCEKSCVEPVLRIINIMRKEGPAACGDAIRGFVKPRVPTPQDVPGQIGKLIHDIAKAAIDDVAGIGDLAVLNPEYLDRLGGAVSAQTLVLIELVRQFERFYSQAKRRLNCLDFADLEHHAIKLLADESSVPGKLVPSETTIALRGRYRYIFVDEYQDINSVQQTILEMVRSEGNLFVVGDVKQSIYQWRGANPQIFIDNLGRASAKPQDSLAGLRVDLNVNFRSDKPVLDFVNSLFGRLMTSSLAKVDYDESAELRPPRCSRKSDLASAVELHILDEEQPQRNNGADEEESGAEGPAEAAARYTADQLQAAMVARRIKEMVGAEGGEAGSQVFDKKTGKMRDATYGDIVILMRSPAGKADFVEVLQLAQIPVAGQIASGYFETTEITDMLCLLKVLDNPIRDIELAAVLRSPLFGVNDSELAEIVLSGRTGEESRNFCDCVLATIKSAPDSATSRKLGRAMNTLERWRTIARRGRLAELLWQCYRETGYLSFVCALPNGAARKANLLKLHDRAIQFESFVSSRPVPSLTRFIDFVERLRSSGRDWSPAEPESAACEDAVRLLSIHKAKGLEFPIVFVADLDSRFNRQDLRADCIVDEHFGLGLRVIDKETNSRLNSLACQVISEEKMRDDLAEEMRVLYVAMTRARHRLVLVGCERGRSAGHLVAAAASFENGPLPDWQLRRCRSHLDWILCGLARHGQLQEILASDLPLREAASRLFDVRLYGQDKLDELSELIDSMRPAAAERRTAAPKRRGKPKSGGLAAVKKSLGWRYRFADDPRLPAKRSVTQWTHRNDEFVRFDYSSALQRLPKAIGAERVDSRTIGTATHLVISHIDLRRPVTGDAVEQVMARLAADGAITQQVCDKIDARSIAGFFETEPGRAALDVKNGVLREWPFTFTIPGGEFVIAERRRPAVSDERIIVQGVIDMLIRTPAGLLVLDFKTDNITGDEAVQRAEMYREQLDFYARAAGTILNCSRPAKYLYFLIPAKLVKL